MIFRKETKNIEINELNKELKKMKNRIKQLGRQLKYT